ncbi:type II secretion system protein GspN [uncultured Desulfuromonas sp.]|uniref:type II secretion system protein GspN n=1 Tax=uncultured Desulfuromonas sp. TaxID=181013 RepID=UPI002AAC14F6|nr:type II secretion system protein GspN [uncultured Desulfuromonas sp.]
MAAVRTSILLKKSLLYILATGAFFLLGLFVFFPSDVIRQRLQQELTVQLQKPVDVGATTLGFPMALDIESTRIAVDPSLSIAAEQLRLTPVWGSLLSGTPAANMTGQLWDGTFDATINSANRLELRANHLHWRGALPEMPTLTLDVQLRDLSLTGTLSENLPLETLTLSLSSLTIEGMKTIGGSENSFSLGELFLQARRENGHLLIEQLQSRDGNLVIQASGRITPGRRPELSRLDLSVTLIPQPSTDPALTSLLQLVTPADKNGHFVLELRGTAARPVLH